MVILKCFLISRHIFYIHRTITNNDRNNNDENVNDDNDDDSGVLTIKYQKNVIIWVDKSIDILF
jgi:hypothetical protein